MSPCGGEVIILRAKLGYLCLKQNVLAVFLRIVNIFYRVRMPFIQSNYSFDQKKWRQKNRLRAINEKLLAFPAYLLTVCVSGYRGGFKVGAFLLGLFADGVLVFFSNCACYIMFAGAFFFARGCE